MPQTTSLTLNPWLKRLFYLAIFITQLMGLLNFPFDYRKKKFLANGRKSKIYCAVLHLCYCGLLPFAITSPSIKEAAYEQRTFYVGLINAITVLRLPAPLLTLWGVWWRSESLFRVIYRFESLRLQNFYTLSESKQCEILRRNDRLIWLKLMTAFSLMIMFYARIFMFVQKPSWPFIWLSVYFGFLESLTIFNLNFFFCGMCYANCALRYIQAELLESKNNLNLLKLHNLSKIFEQICYLIKDLITIFQWQLMAIMLAAMVALVSLFFNLIIWWCTSMDTFKYPLLVFSLQATFANIGDIILIAFICSDTKSCAKNIQQLLSELTDIGDDNVMENNLNFFCLKISVQWTNVNLCRLFELDLQTAFDFVKATFMYLIILVQFDLKLPQ